MSNQGTPVRSLAEEIERFHIDAFAPGTGHIADATDLAASPDGRAVCFSASIYDSLDAPPATRIATLDVPRGAVSLLPLHAGTQRLPRWSPDGHTLAFVAEDPSCRLSTVCLTRDAGLTVSSQQVDGVIESLAWSPDGRRLLLGVAGFGADFAGCQGGATTGTTQSGPAIREPEIDSGDHPNLWRHAWVLDTLRGRLFRLPLYSLNVWEACWLGNDRVAAVVSDSHREGSWYSAWVVEIALSGGVAQTLYRPRDQLGLPAANRRGNRLAVIEALCSDRMLVCGALLVIDAETRAAHRMDTRGADVTGLAWQNDRTIVYAGLRGLETVYGQVDVEEGRAREWSASFEMTCGNLFPAVVADPRGGVLVVGESFAVPPEIARIDDRGYTRLVSLGTAASRTAGFVPGKVEPCSWIGRDGLEIQGILVRPDAPGPRPLVLDVHGGPIYGHRNRWAGRLRGIKALLERGIAVLFPNIRGSSGRGDAFARRVLGDLGGEDAHDCLCGVEAMVARGLADPRRLAVTGVSYGGFMSAWLVTQDARFCAAAAVSPITNWYSQHWTSQIPRFDALFLDGAPCAAGGHYFHRSPVMHAGHVRAPVLLITGGLDRNTPATQGLEFHRAIQEAGGISTLINYPQAGHGVRSLPDSIDATTRQVDWLLEHLLRE